MTLQYPWASNLGPLQIVHVTLNAINDLGRSPQLVWGVFWVDLKYVVFKAQFFFLLPRIVIAFVGTPANFPHRNCVWTLTALNHMPMYTPHEGFKMLVCIYTHVRVMSSSRYRSIV